MWVLPENGEVSESDSDSPRIHIYDLCKHVHSACRGRCLYPPELADSADEMAGGQSSASDMPSLRSDDSDEGEEELPASSPSSSSAHHSMYASLRKHYMQIEGTTNIVMTYMSLVGLHRTDLMQNMTLRKRTVLSRATPIREILLLNSGPSDEFIRVLSTLSRNMWAQKAFRDCITPHQLSNFFARTQMWYHAAIPWICLLTFSTLSSRKRVPSLVRILQR